MPAAHDHLLERIASALERLVMIEEARDGRRDRRKRKAPTREPELVDEKVLRDVDAALAKAGLVRRPRK